MTQKRKRMFDVQSPFFIPLWRRIVFAGAILGWGVFELWLGNTMWASIFGAAGIYLAHQFFVAFDPDTGADVKGTDDDGKDGT